MSDRYPGGVISKTPPTPTGPYQTGTAPGIWTLEQQAQYQKQGIWPVAGLSPNYIEDVFSTYLYSPTVSNESITISNGIDLAGKGGMVWFKKRSAGVQNHSLVDTVRGGTNLLTPNDTFAAYTASIITAFNSTGFTTGTASFVTSAPQDYASWTFRKQPKFFDIVTYTGNGTTNRDVSHNLASVPGAVIIKRTNSTGNWLTVVNTSGNPQLLYLNSTLATRGSVPDPWTSTAVNVGTISLYDDNNDGNINGASYVMYVFASNAGGFGLTGTDNVISCGSVLGGAEANLGYEPQWVLAKATGLASNWFILDTMRGFTGDTVGSAQVLRPNESSAETTNNRGYITSTGFVIKEVNGEPYIYIAIRRGPMKVPTSGTSVFSPLALSNTTSTKNTTGFPVDLQINAERNGVHNTFVVDRLRGVITNDTDTASPYLKTNATSAEATDITALTRYWDNTGFMTASYQSGAGTAYWNFRRAPSFFDEVCYTNPPSSPVDQTHSHNLGVVPTLVITKGRNQAGGWIVLLDSSILGSVKYLYLNTTAAAASGLTYSATSTQYTTSFIGNYNETQVAYLFATCPGVSKVGSYTGTGTLTTINCGFAGGARFVLIKRTDATADWFVWDTARGMVAGTDPSLTMNTTAAEVNANSIYTATTGFQVLAAPAADVNTSGGTYIFLAVA